MKDPVLYLPDPGSPEDGPAIASEEDSAGARYVEVKLGAGYRFRVTRTSNRPQFEGHSGGRGLRFQLQEPGGRVLPGPEVGVVYAEQVIAAIGIAAAGHRLSSPVSSKVLQRPRSVPLRGQFHEFDGIDRDIEVARRIEYPDGRSAVIIEYSDMEEQWELRLESREGRRFLGTMRGREWESDYAVSMKLWRAPDEESEWFLLGVYRHEEGDVDWAITLWEEEPE